MYDSLPQAGIIGHGYALGAQCLTNQDLIDDYGMLKNFNIGEE